MTREIRFRAWDKTDGKMQVLSQLKMNHVTKNWMGFFRDTEQAVDLPLGKIGSGFILMQFTGLKDKNGKEIYEGDIVYNKWNEHFVGRDDGSKSIVFYSQKNGGWATNEFGHDDELNFHLVFHCFPKHTEVIGNIYENPDLLK